MWFFAQAVDGWYQVDQGTAGGSSSDAKARNFFVAVSYTFGFVFMAFAAFFSGAGSSYASV